MKQWFVVRGVSLAWIALLFLTGCASDRSAKTEKAAKKKIVSENQPPSTVKFSEFKNIEVKPFAISEGYAERKKNQNAARFMDEKFQLELAKIFPSLKVLEPNADFTQGGERTLQIIPLIEDIRIVSTSARVWWGAMAGNSHITIRLTFQDSATGQIIAQPEFYEKAGAWTDVWVRRPGNRGT